MRPPLTFIAATAATILFTASAAADPDVVGRASVIDGDTIEIHGERSRFNGIDAPESRQLCKKADGSDYRCGQMAANALSDFLAASSPTRCEFVNRDRYRRFVGNCFRADGMSVSAWMARNGYAFDWPRYSKGAFAADQEAAKRDGAGLWSGSFVLPWEWRKLMAS